MRVDKKSGLLTWVPSEAQIDTVEYALVSTHGVASDTQFVKVFVNHPPIIQKAPPPMTKINVCLLYTSPSPRDRTRSRMPSSA